MGKDLAETFGVAREVFEEVDEVLQLRLSHIMFDGEQAELSRTAVTQPALLAHSVAAYRVLQKECGVSASTPSCVAVMGHSVGEYAALVIAGSFQLADAARLLRLRGLAMQDAADTEVRRSAGSDAGDEPPLCMKALLISIKPIAGNASSPPLPLSSLSAAAAAACAHAMSEGAGRRGLVAGVAALNSPSQLVLSGHSVVVNAAIAALRNDPRFQPAGARIRIDRVVPLQVSAPFHCAVMHAAGARVQEALQERTGALHKVQLVQPSVPLISNSTASALSDPGAIRSALVSGITGPIRWAECVNAAVSLYAKGWIEVGTGSALAGLLKQNAPRAGSGQPGEPSFVASVGNVQDVRALRELLDFEASSR